VGGGVHSTLRPLISLLCPPRVIIIMEKLVEWLAGETEVLGENLPLCPPQTPHAARTRTRAAAVGSQRLTAWATARPFFSYHKSDTNYSHVSYKLTQRQTFLPIRKERHDLFTNVGTVRSWRLRMSWFSDDPTGNWEPGYLSRYSDGLQAGHPRFDSWQVQELVLFSRESRPSLEPNEPGTFSQEVKWQRREADHSSPSSAEINNGGAIPPLPVCFHGVVRN
jgi:hypothetical protein